MELIETILYDKELKNLDLHIKRAKKSAEYFKWKFDEEEWRKLNFKLRVESGKWRVRITYNQTGIKQIEIFPIKKRHFQKFKVIEFNKNYFLKKKNRKIFPTLNSQLSPLNSFDEFILLKNNLVTDTTISNLAFFDGSEWLTPKYPLLKGTKREELLQKRLIKEANIHKYDLKYFKKIAMINAILGFKEIENFDIIF
ncbi:aminotransferase class IV [Caminibacter sp.]